MNGTHNVGAWLREQPWIWSFGAAFAAWLVTFGLAHRGAYETLTAAAIVAVFLVIVGIGQMFVITCGNGNIDLSIPYVMTLSAFVSAGVMQGHDGRLWLGVAAGLLCGLVVANANVVLIRALRIPAIIATLAVGFIVQSAALVRSQGFSADPSPSLVGFTSLRVAGLPVMALVFIAVAALAALVLQRTLFGRAVQAVGQKPRAAWLVGIHVARTVTIAYLISGLLAGLAGVLLSAYSGGASLDIAGPYLLGSIAVVVLGGSLIAGGKSNVAGIWGAAMFLTLLVTMLNVAHLSAAWQDIIEGLIIIGVLVVASGKPAG
jgi:ribose transport system permease protein